MNGIGHEIILGRPSWWPAVLLVLLAAGLVLWRRDRRVSAGVRAVAFTLKVIAVLLLAACLVEPLWSGTRAIPRANLFLVVADNSRSLTIRDRSHPDGRHRQLRQLTADPDQPGEAGWLRQLGRDFDLRRHSIDSRLRGCDEFARLPFDGRASHLATMLAKLRDQYRGQPVAGVILLTDGIAGDIAEADRLAGLPPFYPVIIGDDDVPPDVSVSHISVSQTAFEDMPVTIRSDITADGCADRTLRAKLVDEDGTVLDEQQAVVADDNTRLAFTFRLLPRRAGISFYHVELALDGDVAEASTENNRRPVVVDHRRRKPRVLYVAGRPNWEFKFLNRAVAGDRQLDLVALIRVARREARFDFRGRAGESTNPLFRGFEARDDADAERYDEPVLVRLNTRDSEELAGGFPRTAEELFGFDAIILDDLEAAFFNTEQMALIEQFVSRRGGGLLMLGGQESLREGGFRRTPIGRLLPVYLDSIDEPARSGYGWGLTRDGWLAPWIRLDTNRGTEQERIEQMPRFRTLNRLTGIKPGATLLATATDADGRAWPALVAGPFGHGRVAMMAIGDLWRWRLRVPDRRREFERSWRQLLRWLTADVPERIDVEIQPPSPGGRGSAIARVLVRNAEFEPLENATVSVSADPPDNSDGPPALTVVARPSSEAVGLYEAILPSTAGSTLKLTVEAVDGNGRSVGRRVAGWTDAAAADEFRQVRPDREWLERLASQTGGHVVLPDSLDDFTDELVHRPVPVSDAWTTPLWHQPWMFLVIVGCCVAEWGLRRWKGLP